jgi:pimeloyl-ACP methyl ester carboxylesterase
MSWAALAQRFGGIHGVACWCWRTSPGAVMVPGRPSALSKMMTPRRYLSPSYMQKAAGDIYGGEARRDPKLMSAHTARIIPPQFMGYIYQLMAGMGWTSIHWLHRIRQPTLVMAGSEDPLVPPVNARIIALLIPNNRLFIVGHWPPLRLRS